MVHLQLLRDMPAGFRNDLDAALDRAFELDVPAIGAQIDAFDHFRNRVDVVENVNEPHELRARYHYSTLIASASIPGRRSGCRPSRVVRSAGRPRISDNLLRSLISSTKPKRSGS